MKKHHSILRPIVFLIIILFFVTVILDPYTKSIEETEIIISVGSYPYNRVKVAIWGEIEDKDGDGISDSDEKKGLKLESEYITLSANEYAIYDMELEQSGDYYLNIFYQADTDSELNFNVSFGSSHRSYDESFPSVTDWSARTGIASIGLPEGDVEITISCTLGKIRLDGLQFATNSGIAGMALDADDYSDSNAPGGSLAGKGTVTVFTDYDNPDSDFDGMLDGYEYLAAKDGGWQHPMISNNRYAFILGGGSYKADENFLAFWNTAEAVYNTIHDYYGYEKRNTDLLFWDGVSKGGDIVTGSTEREVVNSTFNSLVAKVGKNDFVFLYMTGHGFFDGDQTNYNEENAKKSGIAIYDSDNPLDNDHITNEWLNGHIKKIYNRAARVTFIMEACFSGRGIEVFPEDGLIYVASSDGALESFGQRDNLGLFGFHALKALQHPALANVPTYKEIVNIDLSFDKDKFMISMEELFSYVKDKILLPPYNQEPQLDGNGNCVANQKDEGIAGNTYL